MGYLDGKTAIVTGAGAGMAKATAIFFAGAVASAWSRYLAPAWASHLGALLWQRASFQL